MRRTSRLGLGLLAGLCATASGATPPQAEPSPTTAQGRFTIDCGADGTATYRVGDNTVASGASCDGLAPSLALSRKFPGGEQVLGVIEPQSATFSSATLILIAPGKPPATISIEYLADLGAMPTPNKLTIGMIGVVSRSGAQSNWSCTLTLDWSRRKIATSVWSGGARAGNCSS